MIAQAVGALGFIFWLDAFPELVSATASDAFLLVGALESCMAGCLAAEALDDFDFFFHFKGGEVKSDSILFLELGERDLRDSCFEYVGRFCKLGVVDASSILDALRCELFVDVAVLRIEFKGNPLDVDVDHLLLFGTSDELPDTVQEGIGRPGLGELLIGLLVVGGDD